MSSIKESPRRFPMAIPREVSIAGEALGRFEYANVTADLRHLSPLEALVVAQARLDAAMESAEVQSKAKTACREGCSYCCYYQVDVSAHEALQIVDFVSKQFSKEKISEFLDAADANAAIIRKLTRAEHRATNIACVFLRDGRCSIYPVRPLHCRTHHATDVEGCKQSYVNPTVDTANTFIPVLFVYGNASKLAIYSALSKSGVDSRMYELTTAFLEGMSSHATLKRYRQGKKAFPTAIVVID